MLKRFEVTNYKGFKNTMVWDLSNTRLYAKNKNLVKNRISKNSIIYGNNGAGKSTLCFAIMEITSHLLDVEMDKTPSYKYSYLGNESKELVFKYVFKFDKNEVIYKYIENNERELLMEQVFVDDVEMIHHNFLKEENNFIKFSEARYLKTKGLPNRLSVLKYIYNNTIVDEKSIIYKIFKFVKGMLCFRSFGELNQYIGYKTGGEGLDNIILKHNKLEDFQNFLKKMDLYYNLIMLRLSSGNTVIGVKFENGAVVQFNDIISSGTRVLMLFYCWLLEFDKLTFLIIDEFDAYYHRKLAIEILNEINKYENLQSVVTTHNVTLLNEKITRPDCSYILDKRGVINLSERIEKEIKQNHNVEKMYRRGLFD